jgi:hypothetical protein
MEAKAVAVHRTRTIGLLVLQRRDEFGLVDALQAIQGVLLDLDELADHVGSHPSVAQPQMPGSMAMAVWVVPALIR